MSSQVATETTELREQEKPKISISATKTKFEEVTAKIASQGLITEICDAIFADLDALCALTKRDGEVCADRVKHTTRSWRGEGPLRGTYVGFGIGKGWIEFGFLEQSVMGAIRERLEKNSAQYQQDDSYSVETMSGCVTVSGGIYMTSTGYYELTRTHAWFLKKRVDK